MVGGDEGKGAGCGDTPGLRAPRGPPPAVCLSPTMVADLLSITWRVGPAVRTSYSLSF